ncbi:alkene reductase [Enterovibrio coralii]|uniref:1,2-oxophytodienoate reductase n=1 Tax=Enterovibrio coralii TaxID=294935 RepID=A0A135IC22_9GAMM|nr:alkene reductase [Enterovibrio coralii]KXF82894.1 1,2-oxophytodienoate reductase [Enterovibrio coralii]
MTTLFTPTAYGSIHAKNRFVMAPMSRNRATEYGVPTPLMATYYAQRASAGLIVTEGIQPDVLGQGFMNSPGLHSKEQVEGWRVVTDAVKKAGGKIVAQLMHCGRVGHPALYPSAHQSVAPSALKAQGKTYTPAGMVDFPMPKAMTKADIDLAIEGFVIASKNAIEAGFDGVEIHAGNGFLLHQFMSSNANQRTDEYGGNVENRLRFTREVIAAFIAEIGADKTAVRISPANPYNDIKEDDTIELYTALVDDLPTLAYVHIMEANVRDVTETIATKLTSPLILNPHLRAEDGPVTGAIARDVLEQQLCEGVAFGAQFIANPDLVERIRVNGPLNELDTTTFYGGDHKGYTDYPTLDKSEVAA